jgi:hypothetical protein
VHLALDAWAAPNGGSFLGLVVLFMDPSVTHGDDPATKGDGQAARAPIRSLILDFVLLEKAHNGEYLADRVMDCLTKFGIERKV